jgi:hypothetical protein
MKDVFGIRWAASFLLFFFGGIFVSLEVFAALAFMAMGRSLTVQAWSLHRFVGLAIAALAVATCISPINRLSSLGRAILIGASIGAAVTLPVYISVPERWQLTWRLGLINLALVAALGLWLYVRGGGGMPPWLSPGWQRARYTLSTFVRASIRR